MKSHILFLTISLLMSLSVFARKPAVEPFVLQDPPHKTENTPYETKAQSYNFEEPTTPQGTGSENSFILVGFILFALPLVLFAGLKVKSSLTNKKSETPPPMASAPIEAPSNVFSLSDAKKKSSSKSDEKDTYKKAS